MTDPVEILAWDSEFFGFTIARLRIDNPTEEDLDRANAWSERAGVRCLYALMPAAAPRLVQRLCAAGYRWVDIRMTLRAALHTGAPASSAPARLARADDIATLRAIAAVSHRDSRFYADPGFPRERCDAFYATWIENSVNGYEDAVWVVDDAEGPAGYLTCKLREAGRGQIGLFGVAARAQGRGVGRALLERAAAWFASQGCTCVDTVTQGANIGAQRIYQRNGFVTQDVQIWLHKWFVRS